MVAGEMRIHSNGMQRNSAEQQDEIEAALESSWPFQEIKEKKNDYM